MDQGDHTVRTRHNSSEEIAWTEILAPDESVVGRVGVAADVVFGKLRHADGWNTSWSSVAIEFENGPSGISVVPAVILTIPDYPCPEQATYFMLAEDAKRIAQQLTGAAIEAEKEMRRLGMMTISDLDKKKRQSMAAESARLTRCSYEGCTKQRHFFDEEGRGYCKRHAEEIGIRPHGKPE